MGVIPFIRLPTISPGPLAYAIVLRRSPKGMLEPFTTSCNKNDVVLKDVIERVFADEMGAGLLTCPLDIVEWETSTTN